MFKLVPQFDPETREFVQFVRSQESPLEPGVYLLPANATFNDLPPDVPGKARYFINDEWVYQNIDGAEPETPAEPTIEERRVLMKVDRGQGRIALLRDGKLGQLEAYISNAANSTDDAVKEFLIAYEDALTWERLSPTTLFFQQILGLTDEQVDALFEAAALVTY